MWSSGGGAKGPARRSALSPERSTGVVWLWRGWAIETSGAHEVVVAVCSAFYFYGVCAFIKTLTRFRQTGLHILPASPKAAAVIATTSHGNADETVCMMLVVSSAIDCAPARQLTSGFNRPRTETLTHRGGLDMSTAAGRGRTQRQRVAAAPAATVPTTGVDPFLSHQPVITDPAAVAAVSAPGRQRVVDKGSMQTDAQARAAPATCGGMEQGSIFDSTASSRTIMEVRVRKRVASLAFVAPGRKNAPLDDFAVCWA